MVQIANKTVKNYLSSLNENEKIKLESILSESDEKLTLKYEIIKEDVVDKLNDLKSKETDNDIKRGGYYDKRGNFVEYNEDQIDKLKALRNLAPAQLIGLTPSEIKTLTNQMRKIMKDRAYLNKMEAKDEERRAKLDQ